MKEFKDLAIFDINYNQLKALPSEIVELTSLTEFCLAGNSITKFPSGTTLLN
jgi:Leucine-rich repeat (LRR) protein